MAANNPARVDTPGNSGHWDYGTNEDGRRVCVCGEPAGHNDPRYGCLLKVWSTATGTNLDHFSMSAMPSFTVGTGFELITSIKPFIMDRTIRELIFVTCFWAKSSSRAEVSDMLSTLSRYGVAQNRTIRVRICLSSMSFMQRLLHTSSPSGKQSSWFTAQKFRQSFTLRFERSRFSPGYIFDHSEWNSKLGLPPPAQLPGLDLEIKSVFVRPFSVMHSKFILIDRRICLLPSCNVSWEDWFEVCADLRGPVVEQLYTYFESFWGRGDEKFSLGADVVPMQRSDFVGPTYLHQELGLIGLPPLDSTPFSAGMGSLRYIEDRDRLPESKSLPGQEIPMLFLPSPYHSKPHFRPFVCQKYVPPPPTPLNTFLLYLFDNAETSILIRTPNLTSRPVIDALTNALDRGVSVNIVTNKKLMTLEQIVTAGTTTPNCMMTLTRKHRMLMKEREKSFRRAMAAGRYEDRPVGQLTIAYHDAPVTRNPPDPPSILPVKAHLKVTIVDGKYLVLGSGNMDRASWYTSQEIGVAMHSQIIAKEVEELIGRQRT